MKDRLVEQRHSKAAVLFAKLWRLQEALFHLVEDPWNPFAFLAHDSRIGEQTDDERIATGVNGFPLSECLQCDRSNQRARAADLHPVVVEPDFNLLSLNSVVAMRERVDDGLLPGELGVFGSLFEEQVVELF